MEFDSPERQAFDDAMTRFLRTAVQRILDLEEADAFLAWMRGEAVGLFPEIFPEGEEPHHRDAAALTMGRALWNATPLPADGYRPRPLAQPFPNAPCTCGSGMAYRECCQEVDEQLSVPPEVVWPLLMELLPHQEAERVVAEGLVPLDSVGLLAEKLMHAGAWSRTVGLLEPRFNDGAARFDERDEFLFEMLMDAYLEQGATRKRSTLIKRLLETSRPPFRAVVWEREALIRSDGGDREGAWEAFHQAQRDNPESVRIGALEVTLLMAEGDLERLAERSRYWIARFRRMGLPPEHPTLALFERLTDDPAATLAAMGDVGEAGAVGRLIELLASAADAPLPRYALEPMELGTESGGEAYVLMSSAAQQKLEDRWRERWPMEKPFSVNAQPIDEYDVWEPEVAEGWLAFLEENPKALSNLSILDDLAMGIAQLEHAYTEPVLETLWAPLLSRAEAVIDRALKGESEAELPWLVEENRPALRLLAHLANLHELRHDEAAEQALYERLLALNPNDNHGYRIRVINQRLAAGDDEGALVIAERYPDDHMVDVSFGRALALHRLGRTEAADEALRKAVEQSPLVAEYLLAKRVRKPRIDHFGVTVGGPDEAWLYRDAMRKVWAESKGALAWLKGMASD